MSVLIVAQPQAPYASRQPLVVDASVLACALFGEAQNDLAISWMRGHALAAPQLVDYEIANIALNKARRGEVAPEAAAQSIALFSELELARMPVAVDGVHALATQYRLTAYDAAYLWLAVQLNAPLATFDKKLGEAAQTCLGALATS